MLRLLLPRLLPLLQNRLPLLLKYDEEMQEKEIAAALHLPRGTVSSRIARGLEMIRKEMKEEEVQNASGRYEESFSV